MKGIVGEGVRKGRKKKRRPTDVDGLKRAIGLSDLLETT